MGISASQFVSLIDQAEIWSGDRRTLCFDQKNQRYTLYSGTKQDLEIYKYEKPLSLKEIIQIGCKLEGPSFDDLKNARGLSQAIIKMSQAKEAKENGRNLLSRLIVKIMQCIFNFFHGLGFQTTAKAAAAFANRLETLDRLPNPNRGNGGGTDNRQRGGGFRPRPRVGGGGNATPQAPRRHSVNIPRNVVDTPIVRTGEHAFQSLALRNVATEEAERECVVYVPTLLTDNPPLDYAPETQGGKDKLRLIEEFKLNPEGCRRVTRNTIFSDIQCALTDNNPSADLAVSTEGLILIYTGKSNVDFNDPDAIFILKEVLSVCKKKVEVEIVEWLRDKQLFTPNLLKMIFHVLITKNGSASIDPYSLEVLLNYYLDYAYNYYNNDEGDRIIPSSYSPIISALKILIDNHHTGDRIERLITSFMRFKEYNFTTFCRWIMVYQNKERGQPRIPEQPIRDMLIRDFLGRPEWLTDIQSREEELKEYVYTRAESIRTSESI